MYFSKLFKDFQGLVCLYNWLIIHLENYFLKLGRYNLIGGEDVQMSGDKLHL